MVGKLIIFSAPSGSGKSTIINHLLGLHLPLQFSISATSRSPRGNEKEGVDYYFMSPDEFRKKIEANEFLEYEEVYADTFYGTPKSEVDRITQSGNHVILDVDVVGGCNIKKQYGSQALSIFIQPPSIGELRKRLENRATDSAEVIDKRIAKASYELGFAPQFDVIIINDDLQKALNETVQTVKLFLNDE